MRVCVDVFTISSNWCGDGCNGWNQTSIKLSRNYLICTRGDDDREDGRVREREREQEWWRGGRRGPQSWLSRVGKPKRGDGGLAGWRDGTGLLTVGVGRVGVDQQQRTGDETGAVGRVE